MNISRYLRPAAYVRWINHAVMSPIESKRGQRELTDRFPELSALPALGEQKAKDLLPFYEEYVSTISGRGTAASFELATFMAVMCDIIKPKTTLDFGSGFSSLVLRRYATQVGQPVETWSVDEHEGWLEKTRQFLDAHRLPLEHIESWESFSQGSDQTFDLILHDPTMELKIGALEKILSLGSPGGVVILDDTNDHVYRAHAKRVIARAGCHPFSLKWCTEDRNGRYSMLVGL